MASTTNYHIPIVKGDPVDDDVVNARFSALDGQITANSASIMALENEMVDARGGKDTLTQAVAQVIGQTPPSSSSDTGTAGELRGDTNKLYVCVATNTWKQITLENWS